MEIQTRNLIDIERYTNDIRTHVLKEVRDVMTSAVDDEGERIYMNGEVDGITALVSASFDRANVKALFAHITQEPPADALFRDKLHGPGTQAALGESSKPGPKAGSAAARKRAQKAAATRASNKASRGTVDALPSGNNSIGQKIGSGIPGTSSAQFNVPGPGLKDGE
jgi:hypothetical protein